MPKVNIIIATRNRCILLQRAVESAFRAGNDVGIIVVDDSSEDQTREVCQNWTNVRYIRPELRLGLGGARNVGLLASDAPYVNFLDDDDVRLPGSIDAQVDMLNATPDAGLIYGRALYGDQEGRTHGTFYPERCPQGDIFWELLRSNFIPCATVLFRRDCLTRVGLVEEQSPGVEDWDLWVRIAELYPVLATEDVTAVWRQPKVSSGQFTSRPDKLHCEARRLHRDKWLRLPRAVEAGTTRRRAAARGFADAASQQMVWEAADRFKGRHLREFARVALAGARMYPLGVTRKFLSASTKVLAR